MHSGLFFALCVFLQTGICIFYTRQMQPAGSLFQREYITATSYYQNGKIFFLNWDDPKHTQQDDDLH